MKIASIKKNLKFLAISLLILACQNGQKSIDNSPDTSDIINDTLHKFKEDIPQTNSLPPVEMLLPVQYRKESTGYPIKVENKDWYEFYKDEKTGDWKIEKAKLQITYGRDECVGEDVMIIKSSHETAIMFFTSFEGMSMNPVTILEDKSIFPERNLSFDFHGKDYRLSPMGIFKDDDGNIIPISVANVTSEENLSSMQIDNYTLTFSAPRNISYTIASIPQMISVTPQVIWAGDMNGDGLPDLVLNLSDFYEALHIFLFLSDDTDLEKPLKKAADLNVVNDC